MKNLNIVIRGILRQKLNSAIIIISLSIGMACLMLISIFIERELKTDSFHKDSQRIYALSCDDVWESGSKMYYCREGAGEYMEKNFPQVESFCRVRKQSVNRVEVNKNEFFDDIKALEVSPNFFSFFSFELLTNNPLNALESKNSVVISNVLAKKYFGSGNPLGQVLRLSGQRNFFATEQDYVVGGVFKKPVDNTQIVFDILTHFKGGDSECFVKLAANATPNEVEHLCLKYTKDIPRVFSGEQSGQYYLSTLTKTHFDKPQRADIDGKRSKRDIWVAAIIGLLIMVVALFNFFGLLNNRLEQKHKEFSIRQLNGGTKWNLIYWFIVEQTILILTSMFLGTLGLALALPYFNTLINTNINIEYIFRPASILIQIVFMAMVWLLSYVFIILKLSFKKSTSLHIAKKQYDEKVRYIPVFNMLQLAISTTLIVASIVIIKQMHFISNKPLGLDKEVFQVRLPMSYTERSTLFKKELTSCTAIASASVSSSSPIIGHWKIFLDYEDGGKTYSYMPSGFDGDADLINTMGIKLTKGELFKGNAKENKGNCLVNQSFVKKFPGWDLLGHPMPGNPSSTIIGVVEDFHYIDLKQKIEASYIICQDLGNLVLVKPVKGQELEAREYLMATWQKLVPDYPVNIETIGEHYEWLHRANSNFIQLISVCGGLSIFLSMIGLFAVSVQSSRQRIKEIGIRKVNGAKTAEIMQMLNQNYLIWLSLAFILSVPVAWFTMNGWLSTFAYKTELSWWVFALTGIIVLFIALLTVSWQSWRAATRNPVEALRCE